MNMRLMRRAALAITCLVIAGCGGGNQKTNPAILGGPQLTWSAAWLQGTQAGPIAFQAIGQNATLTATVSANTTQPPYQVSVSGGCVTASASVTSSAVQVTAVSAGTCEVWVGTSSIQATTP